ncbi:hypothetical protein MSAN_01044600 [Mycena sanguinolenta]|uniref:Uncharacterized protein n=1 Tax=Mycena sanguinolenta TaxID=230812 RepID=A0A8H7D9P4_9AGAR|nr:hypothetical protein MSAN_01044600 [Mycena sanguinolenta]
MSSITDVSDARNQHNSPLESKEVAPSPKPLPPGLDYQMVGGIYILNAEGLRWFEEKYGRELPKDHSGDATIRMQLAKLLTEQEGQPFGVNYIPRHGVRWCDFLAATQVERREVWEHVPVLGEVTAPEQKMSGDTPREEEMRRILSKLGVQATEFKCYFLCYYYD